MPETWRGSLQGETLETAPFALSVGLFCPDGIRHAARINERGAGVHGRRDAWCF
jgi:hypothetical protein